MDQLTQSLYQAAGDARLWEPALVGLAERFRSAAATCLMYQGLEAVGARTTPRMRDVSHAFFEQRMWENDGRIAHFQQTPIEHFVVTDQHFPAELLAQNEVLRMMAGMGLRHQAGAGILLADGEHVTVFMLDRTTDEGTFSPAELARLNRLRTHLAGAAQLAHMLAHDRARQATAVLQDVGQPAAVLDRRGGVQACNTLFEADFARWAEHGAQRRFRLRNRRAQALLDAAWARLHTDEPVAHIRVPTLQGDWRQLQLRPLLGASSDSLWGGHALLLVEPLAAAAAPQTPGQLSHRYGLTDKEARLAGLLADGTPLRAAGQSLGLSYNSARTYLDRVFAKTGTHRQAELVRLVLSSRGP